MKSNILKTFFTKNIKPFLINQDWVYKNHLVYKNINDSVLLRGFCFNSSAFSATQFEVVAFIQPLYIPFPHIFLTFGKTIRTPKNMQWWNYEENNKEQQGKDLANFMNQIDDSFFSKIIDAESFYHYYKKDKKISLSHFESVAYSACFTNMPNALSEIVDLKTFISKKEDIKKPYVNDAFERTINIENILRTNESAQELLTNWMLDTKKALKI